VLRAKSVRRLSVCCIPKPLLFAAVLFGTVGDEPVSAFPTEKKSEKARFCLAFFDFQKSQRCSNKAIITKSGFKKNKLASLLMGSYSGGLVLNSA